MTALLAVQWLRIHLAMQAATGLVPGQGTKIPHAVEQLSQSTKSVACHGAAELAQLWGWGGGQFSSVSQSSPTLCDPMNRSMPGLPVHHQLLEFTQTHVHQVGNAIQLSHPLLSPSPPAHNPS